MKNDASYTTNPSVKAANDIYSLYFIGWLLGFLAFIIGAVWAGVEMKRKRGFVRSHFQFQHNVAVQGTGVLSVCALLMFGWYTLYDDRWLTLLTVLLSILFVWWWLWRCIAGYRILSAQKAIANPNTWGRPRVEHIQLNQNEETHERGKIQR